MGLETMNEQADKRIFFHDEEEGLLDVDYNKKLAEISTSESVSPDGYVGDTMLCFDENKRLILDQLRTVPTIVTAHTFCASPDTRISYRQCLLIQGYFCAV